MTENCILPNRLLECFLEPTIQAALLCLVNTELNLGVCILLRVLDQVQGVPSNATLFQ
jgi:hypothetical protein